MEWNVEWIPKLYLYGQRNKLDIYRVLINGGAPIRIIFLRVANLSRVRDIDNMRKYNSYLQTAM